MLDEALRLIQQAADVGHAIGPVAKPMAQLDLDFS
jgi:hypothetical protein